MDLIINHAYMRKLHKIQIVWGSESFQVGKHIHIWRVTHPNSIGTEAPALWTLPDLIPRISSSGCSSVSFIVTFNKLVNGRKEVFP